MNQPQLVNNSLDQEVFTGLRNKIRLILRKVLSPTGAHDSDLRALFNERPYKDTVNLVLMNAAAVLGYNIKGLFLFKLDQDQFSKLSELLLALISDHPEDQAESLEKEIFINIADVLAELYYPLTTRIKYPELKQMSAEALVDFRHSVLDGNQKTFAERSQELSKQTELQQRFTKVLYRSDLADAIDSYLESHIHTVIHSWTGRYDELSEVIRNKLAQNSLDNSDQFFSINRFIMFLTNNTPLHDPESSKIVIEYVMFKLGKAMDKAGLLRVELSSEVQIEKLAEIFGLENPKIEDSISHILIELNAGASIGTAVELTLDSIYHVASVEELTQRSIEMLGDFRNALTEEGPVLASSIRSYAGLIRASVYSIVADKTLEQSDQETVKKLVNKLILHSALFSYVSMALSKLGVNEHQKKVKEIIDEIIERATTRKSEEQ